MARLWQYNRFSNRGPKLGSISFLRMKGILLLNKRRTKGLQRLKQIITGRHCQYTSAVPYIEGYSFEQSPSQIERRRGNGTVMQLSNHSHSSDPNPPQVTQQNQLHMPPPQINPGLFPFFIQRKRVSSGPEQVKIYDSVDMVWFIKRYILCSNS